MASGSDSSGILSIYRPIVLETAITFELDSPTVSDMAMRISKCQQQHSWLVCTHGTQVAGYAYASTFRERPAYRWITEVSVYVHPYYYGKRIAKSLYDALHHILKAQGYLTAMAVMTYPNVPSEQFHLRYGYKDVCLLPSMGYKFDTWHGIKIMSKTLNQPSTPMKEIVPVSQLDQGLVDGAFQKSIELLRSINQ